DAEGAARRVVACAPTTRIIGYHTRNAVCAVPGGVVRTRPGRRSDRGAQGDAGPPVAQRPPRVAGSVSLRTPVAVARGRRSEVRRQARRYPPRVVANSDRLGGTHVG